jgi:hypothetical protein
MQTRLLCEAISGATMNCVADAPGSLAEGWSADVANVEKRLTEGMPKGGIEENPIT